MLHYYAKEFFAPLLISAYQDHYDLYNKTKEEPRIHVHLTSDVNEPLQCFTDITIMDWKGNQMWRKTQNINLNPLESKSIFVETVAKLLKDSKCKREENCFITLYANSSSLVSENVFYFSPLHKVDLPDPQFKTANFVKEGKTIKFDLMSDQMAPYTFLDTIIKGRFSQNGFHALKNQIRRIEFYGYEEFSVERFISTLTIKSMKSVTK